VQPYEVRRDGYLVSTDRSRLDLDAIHGLLPYPNTYTIGATAHA
jgi:hypothetical protein